MQCLLVLPTTGVVLVGLGVGETESNVSLLVLIGIAIVLEDGEGKRM